MNLVTSNSSVAPFAAWLVCLTVALTVAVIPAEAAPEASFDADARRPGAADAEATPDDEAANASPASDEPAPADTVSEGARADTVSEGAVGEPTWSDDPALAEMAQEYAPGDGAEPDDPSLRPASAGPQCLPQLLPVDGMGEFGAAVGMLVPSRRHNFQVESLPHQRIEAAPEVALRGAWFPLAQFGIEGEGALGSGRAEDGTAAYPWALRLHAIGQLGLPRVTPFALLGFGRMGSISNALGSDGDPLLHFGVGAKVYLSERALVRFDFRDNLTQRQGSPEGSLTNSLEVLVGASVVLGK